jgi:DNA-directed RNA polymerase specialized sigma24 family protein
VTLVPEDFAEFVTARWHELYAVATVTTGDASSAARATASALAALARRWRETTDSGAPTDAARAAVLRAALSAAEDAVAPVRADAAPDEHGNHEHGDDDHVRAALTAALATAPPTARAALAVRHWWDQEPTAAATAAGAEVEAVRSELTDLERRLAAAHAAALGRDEPELAWALPAAVADALEHAVDSAPVADPVGLVSAAGDRATRRRRTRAAVVGAALALAVAATTALAWPGLGAAEPTAPTGPVRDDPSWASVGSWGARGPLVDDPTVASIATDARRADPTARLLYAGRVGDTLAVVMTGASPGDPTLPAGVPGPALGEGFDGKQSFLRLWTAAAPLGPASLVPTTIDGEPTTRTGDLVALSVKQHTAGAPPTVLVLTRPSVTDGAVITGALPQPDGSVRPVVVSLPLVDGVATFGPTRVGFTPEVAVAGYRGAPAGALTNSYALPSSGPAERVAVAQRILVAGVTGHRPDSLATASVLEGVVPASAVDPDYVGTYPDFVGTHPQPLRVTVVTTTTRDGARVRTTRLAGSTDDAPWTYLERLVAVPATDSHALLLLPSGRNPGFVAIAPDGAVAELVTSDGRLRDSATIRDGLATLTSAEDPQSTEFRLRVRAPDGHVVYDAVPPRPVELVDSGAAAH